MNDDAGFVIIGASLAGAKGAEALRAEGWGGRIRLIGSEPHLPYERPPLSKGYLLGSAERESVFVHDKDWYGQHDVDLTLGVAVTGLDTAGHEVHLADESLVELLARLLAAQGARVGELTRRSPLSRLAPTTRKITPPTSNFNATTHSVMSRATVLSSRTTSVGRSGR